MHIANECHRSTKADCAKLEEVEDELLYSIWGYQSGYVYWLLVTGCWLLVTTFHMQCRHAHRWVDREDTIDGDTI